MLNSNFIQYFAEDIIENLQLLGNDFKNILEINCGSGRTTDGLKVLYPKAQIVVADSSRELIQYIDHLDRVVADYEHLPFKSGSFDLIVFNCGLHWINDVPKFLLQIFDCLTTDGIFIANFIGNNSLKNLRLKLINLEANTGNVHSPHVSPFIKFEDVGALLQNAKFSMHCTNFQTINLRYKNVLNLIRDLQNHGASNCLNSSKYYSITKEMYRILLDDSTMFEDNIDLINILASRNKHGLKISSNEII